MKKYIKANAMTTEEVAEKLRKEGHLYTSYTTKKGNRYYCLIYQDGIVEAEREYTVSRVNSDGFACGGYRTTGKMVYKIPKEVQNYLIDKYGQALSELGITLRF